MLILSRLRWLAMNLVMHFLIFFDFYLYSHYCNELKPINNNNLRQLQLLSPHFLLEVFYTNIGVIHELILQLTFIN